MVTHFAVLPRFATAEVAQADKSSVRLFGSPATVSWPEGPELVGSFASQPFG